MQGGARFIQVLIGLFPEAVNMLKPPAAAGNAQPPACPAVAHAGIVLLDELTQALHAVVLDSQDADVRGHGTDPGDGYACATQLLKTLAEIVGKLRPHELDSLGSVFKRPSLCALLVESPSAGSLNGLPWNVGSNQGGINVVIWVIFLGNFVNVTMILMIILYISEYFIVN